MALRPRDKCSADNCAVGPEPPRPPAPRFIFLIYHIGRNSDFGDPYIRPNPNPNPNNSTFAFVFVLITAWDSDSYSDSFKRMDDSEGALPPREEGFEEQHPTSKRARLEDEPEAAAEAAFEQSSDEDSITSEGNGDESNTARAVATREALLRLTN